MCTFNLVLFINIMCTYVYSVDDQLMDAVSIFKKYRNSTAMVLCVSLHTLTYFFIVTFIDDM